MHFAIENPQNAEVKIDQVSESTELIQLYRISVHFTAATEPQPVTVSWKQPMVNQYSVWHPLCSRYRAMPQWFGKQISRSRFFSGAPVISVVTPDGMNQTTAALLDCVKPTELTFDVDDYHQQDEVDFSAVLFANHTEAITDYETYLRIDLRSIPMYDAVQDAAKWWQNKLEIIKNIPELSYAPLYSSWYNFHQNPEQTLLTEELKAAAEAGFRTAILDDGWQFEGESTKDYKKAGDWKVAKDKFPDFVKFVQDAHAAGLKLIVWFTTPFVGLLSESYKKYRNKLLCEIPDVMGAGVLDIRYPDVREFIVGTYVDFIEKYNIDGLKLDFLDAFDIRPESPAWNENMDCDTVEKAVFVLLDEIKKRTEAIKPDFLFEFRQTYVGPEILKYGTMIRVCDCAYDSVTNRIGTIDLRMMTTDIAVHSDMLLWAKDENIINCGLQLLNIMFSVPQISVLLTKCPEEQRKLVTGFVNYWSRNRDTLMEGTLLLSHPEANYSAVTAKKGERSITVLYAENSYKYDGGISDVWNASYADRIIIRNTTGKTIHATVYDGRYMETDSFDTDAPLFDYPVPVAGYINIRG